jgi:hypothetical protein
LLAGARDRYGMAAVRIYLPILIERDLRRRLQNRPYEQVNGRDQGGAPLKACSKVDLRRLLLLVVTDHDLSRPGRSPARAEQNPEGASGWRVRR